MRPHGRISLIGSDVKFYVDKIILDPSTEFHVGRSHLGASPVPKRALRHTPDGRQLSRAHKPAGFDSGSLIWKLANSPSGGAGSCLRTTIFPICFTS